MTASNPIESKEPLDKSRESAIMQNLLSYASLSNLLRLLGAGVLVTSVSVFLFKGWSTGNDVDRYLMLLTHTLLLAGTGLIIGRWVKESKGARLFLGLAQIFAVVNFTVLGGLIYSQIQWDGTLLAYPSFARWQADSLVIALTISAAAWALLAPVAWVGFMAMARRSAPRLTVLFMLAASALLIPIRGAELITALVSGLIVFLLIQVLEAKRRDVTLATFEGRFARLLLFAPPLIMIGRGLYLYSTSFLLLTVISGLVVITMRQLVVGSDLSERTRSLLNGFSVLPALATAAFATASLADTNWLSMSAWLPTFAALFASLLVEISLRTERGVNYRRAAAIVVAAGMLTNMWLFPGLGTALVAAASGLAVMIYGYSVQQRIVFGAGLVTLLFGVAYQCQLAFTVFNFGNWTTLAMMGTLAIIAGSLLERHGTIVRARIEHWRKTFKQWEN